MTAATLETVTALTSVAVATVFMALTIHLNHRKNVLLGQVGNLTGRICSQKLKCYDLERAIEGLTAELDTYLDKEVSLRETFLRLPKVHLSASSRPHDGLTMLRIYADQPTLNYYLTNAEILKMPFTEEKYQRLFADRVATRWARHYVDVVAPQIFEFMKTHLSAAKAVHG